MVEKCGGGCVGGWGRCVERESLQPHPYSPLLIVEGSSPELYHLLLYAAHWFLITEGDRLSQV